MIAIMIYAAMSAAQVGYHWENVAIVGGGFTPGIITCPTAKDVVYLRTDMGGPYRLDSKTHRWVPIADWLERKDWNLCGVDSIAIDPSDPKRSYMALGAYTQSFGKPGAIFRSEDGGVTWKRTDLPFKNGGNCGGRSIGERLQVDPHDGRVLYFGSRENGLWRSRDRGVTWEPVRTFPENERTNGVGLGWVLFDGRKGITGMPTETIYVGLDAKGGKIFRSTNAGATWSQVSGSPAGLLPHHAALGANGKLYITFADAPGPNGASKGQVCAYDPDSREWADITPLKTEGVEKFGYAGLCLDAQKPGTMVVSTLDRWGKDTIFRSRDYGKTWVSLAEQARRDASKAPYLKWGNKAPEFGHWVGDVKIDPFDSNHAWYVTGATVWETHDLTAADAGMGTHWTVGAEGIEENAITDLVSPPVGPHLVSAMGDIAGFRHDDLHVSPPGGMWTNPLLSTVTSIAFAEKKPNVFVRVGSGYSDSHGSISFDGAKTWRPISFPPGGRANGSVALSADGATILWLGHGGRPAYSTDDGATWQTCAGAPREGKVVADRVDPNTFYIQEQGSGAVYRSSNRGKSFIITTNSMHVDNGRLVAVFGQKGHLWLPAVNGLMRSIDGGMSFTKVSDIVAEKVSFGKAAPGKSYPTVYAFGVLKGVTGVFRSVDEGQTWDHINDRSVGFNTFEQICGDPKVFGRVYVGTNGRGIWVGDPANQQRK